MSGADTWMPLYVGDYLADTPQLSLAQHGAYLLLLMGLWRLGGKIDDCDITLAAITRSTPQEWKKLRPVLQKFCTVADGVWTQKRLTVEMEKAQARYAAQVANGKKGGRPKRNTEPDGANVHDANETNRLATGSVTQTNGVAQPQSQPYPQGSALGVDLLLPGPLGGAGGANPWAAQWPPNVVLSGADRSRPCRIALDCPREPSEH